VTLSVKQKLKTRVIKKNINPEWNEDLTLSVSDPSIPIKLVSLFPGNLMWHLNWSITIRENSSLY
jgi:hypothetical protein